MGLGINVRHCLLTATVFVCAGLIAPAAQATHSNSGTYFSGYLDPGQGDGSSFDDNCFRAIYYDQMSKPFGPEGTVAFIRADGYGWYATRSGTTSLVSTQISSGEAWSFRKKAHCNNSGGSRYFATCDYTWYVGHSCV